MMTVAERIAEFLESRFRIPQESSILWMKRMLMVLAGASFMLVATVIVAFDSFFLSFSNTLALRVGAVAPRDIIAPPNPAPYPSNILTARAREEERAAVQPVLDPPDPVVARQQTQIAQEILAYIEDVRSDVYGGDLRLNDLDAITALSLDDDVKETILGLDDERWSEVKSEIQNVLSLVMRREIQVAQLQRVREQLSNQVNPSFVLNESEVVVAIVEDLVQANTFENVEETEALREQAATAVETQTRQLTGGQVIVREGELISELDLEALQALNLLNTNESQMQEIARALLASTITMVIISLYLSRFAPQILYTQTRRLTLLAVIFLLMLATTRLLGIQGDIYLFPTTALSMLYIAIAGPQVAVISGLGLAFLTGLIANNSLQIATLVAAGNLMAALTLRRAERLNSFFVAGLVVGLMNAAVIVVFNIASTNAINDIDIARQVMFAFFNGLLLAPATTIAAMYLLTFLFNLPTALKLIDLSQPNKPLLQRLLREAPGTYQHTLQVANLAEQAANAIGADAQLTHVSALYHDIGKMLNPLYFTENQQDIGNPHDTLGDPYRSADIIIGHVTEGDELARQYHLPNRIRDFIREHHGTTQVYVFYQRALKQVDGDESAVDIADFTYPGPRPQSKETAILMLADSCEAAVRSVKPESKQDISELVNTIMEDKRRSGQLDASSLTLNDLRAIRTIFVEILQGMFHPRINYKEAVDQKLPTPTTPKSTPKVATPANEAGEKAADDHAVTPSDGSQSTPEKQTSLNKTSRPAEASAAPMPAEAGRDTASEIEDEEPLSEVPRLPSMDERRATGNHLSIASSDNGQEAAEAQTSSQQDESQES